MSFKSRFFYDHIVPLYFFLSPRHNQKGIQVYNLVLEEDPLTIAGSPSGLPGSSMDLLSYPSAFCIRGDFVYVFDHGNNRLQMWDMISNTPSTVKTVSKDTLGMRGKRASVCVVSSVTRTKKNR